MTWRATPGRSPCEASGVPRAGYLAGNARPAALRTPTLTTFRPRGRRGCAYKPTDTRFGSPGLTGRPAAEGAARRYPPRAGASWGAASLARPANTLTVAEPTAPASLASTVLLMRAKPSRTDRNCYCAAVLDIFARASNNCAVLSHNPEGNYPCVRPISATPAPPHWPKRCC